MSAAVSLADRCLDPPENTSRVVGETAGCQGRVLACQHGVTRAKVTFWPVRTMAAFVLVFDGLLPRQPALP